MKCKEKISKEEKLNKVNTEVKKYKCPLCNCMVIDIQLHYITNHKKPRSGWQRFCEVNNISNN